MIFLKQLMFEQLPGGAPCNMWSRKGVEYWNGEGGRPKITINATDSRLTLTYVGKGKGHVISTVSTAGDSLHQAWNVVSCETNNYIKKGGLKPIISDISATCTTSNGIYDLSIEIPFETVDSSLVYQINRRGGWGHKGDTATLPKSGPNFEGPVTHVTRFGSEYVMEHWVTYTISGKDVKKTPEVDKKSNNVIHKEKQRLAKDKESTNNVKIKKTIQKTTTHKNKK